MEKKRGKKTKRHATRKRKTDPVGKKYEVFLATEKLEK